MKIVDKITITELARLTRKSRPTLYRYVEAYENDKFDEVPYFFVMLFEQIKSGASRKKIEELCFSHFGNDDSVTKEVVDYINQNKDKIDFNKLLDYLKENTNDKWYSGCGTKT